ncbi:TadE family type IV pilus minor pilin [Kocuria sp. JC486]|uniref:TadE family type IV pilus minor pilin n=1 Tax=Kocuria sp. JC486 TaxID=1970736 RepID=UPI001ADD86C9|nr:TadE family type IV pilus minor pilin [Kocuria sp. JC486]
MFAHIINRLHGSLSDPRHRARSQSSHSKDHPKDHSKDRGAVTAETAIVFPAIVLTLAVVLAGGAAATIQVRCEEAAGAAARVVARGESEATAVHEARSIAGDSAEVSVEIRDGRAEAEVIVPAPGILADWGGLELSATAATITEGVVLDEQ